MSGDRGFTIYPSNLLSKCKTPTLTPPYLNLYFAWTTTFARNESTMYENTDFTVPTNIRTPTLTPPACTTTFADSTNLRLIERTIEEDEGFT